MSIYNPTAIDLITYFLIFGIGFITGRLAMAIQVGLMKTVSKTGPKNKSSSSPFKKRVKL